MSHGGQDNCEPNLVPLLDLVLQLVMFFMMCTNFIMEEVNQSIKLPIAQSARPMKETGTDVVFLNINDRGQLLVLEKPEPLNDAEMAHYLQNVYDAGKRRAAEEARKGGSDPAQAKVETLVIVRAHKDVDYSEVYKVMRKCQDLGLRKLQLRASFGGK